MSALRTLRLVSYLEGLSFLLLLFIAMPLSHGLGLHAAVRIAGALHGLLFLLLLSTLLRIRFENAWPPRNSIRVLALALVPLGFLGAERLLRRAVATEP
jgi:integral membrane protein